MNKKLNANLVKLVSLLSDGQYHDGTTIGDALHMTRSAVWKAIKKLENYQVKIDCIKGKGYALLEPLILLNSHQIKKNLTSRDANIIIFENINSTNAYLKTVDHDAITICLAEQQTEGKGRFNREWYSPFGKNIYLSCLYPFQKDVSELSGLSLVMSLAVIKTLKSFGVDEKLFVKWPNDIVYDDNKKISGSLIEIQAETHGACHAIIGLGVNVNMVDGNEVITQPFASMQQILKKYVDRNLVCISLLNNLFDYLQRFEANGLQPFVKEWNQADGLMNKKIAVTTLHEVGEGRVQGINEHGHLLMEVNGRLRAFSSGDTSIVK